MANLSALDAITLEAFQAALTTFREQGLALPTGIQAVVDDLENHIDELDELSELNAEFESLYQEKRRLIQGQSAERNKRMSTTQVNPTVLQKGLTFPLTPPSPWQSGEVHSDNVGPNAKNEPSVPNASDNEQSDITPSRPSPKPAKHRARKPTKIWDNVDRIAIMAAGGAFLGGAIVQLLGGGASQLIGALLGAIVGCLAGLYVTSKTSHSQRNS